MRDGAAGAGRARERREEQEEQEGDDDRHADTPELEVGGDPVAVDGQPVERLVAQAGTEELLQPVVCRWASSAHTLVRPVS